MTRKTGKRNRNEYMRMYMRRYRAERPDNAMQYRLNAAVNLLEQHGYTVTAPNSEGGEQHA